MTWLNYYDEENKRWPQLHAARCTKEEAEAAIWELWSGVVIPDVMEKLPLPIHAPKIKFTSGNRHSKANRFRIVLNVDYLNWLLVAHELAHAWDDIRHKADLLSSKHRWHGIHHQRLTDKLCREMIARKWPQGTLGEQVFTKLEAKAAKLQENRTRARARVETAKSTEARIIKRVEQVARLERKIKTLTTRLKTARRSLAALERAQTKKERS